MLAAATGNDEPVGHSPKSQSNLVAAHPENTNGLRHGAYSPRLQDARAREIAEQVLEGPWTCEQDTLGAIEIGRLEALIERLDQAIGSMKRLPNRDLIELRLRASRVQPIGVAMARSLGTDPRASGARGEASASASQKTRAIRPGIPRLALSPTEAAVSLGVSRDFFDEHIAPELRIARRGRRK